MDQEGHDSIFYCLRNDHTLITRHIASKPYLRSYDTSSYIGEIIRNWAVYSKDKQRKIFENIKELSYFGKLDSSILRLLSSSGIDAELQDLIIQEYKNELSEESLAIFNQTFKQ